MTTKADLQAAIANFKAAVIDFAEKRVNEPYDPRIHDAVDASGNVHQGANPLKTIVNGEESKVGHIMAAFENVIEPLVNDLKGETVAEPAPA